MTRSVVGYVTCYGSYLLWHYDRGLDVTDLTLICKSDVRREKKEKDNIIIKNSLCTIKSGEEKIPKRRNSKEK